MIKINDKFSYAPVFPGWTLYEDGVPSSYKCRVEMSKYLLSAGVDRYDIGRAFTEIEKGYSVKDD